MYILGMKLCFYSLITYCVIFYLAIWFRISSSQDNGPRESRRDAQVRRTRRQLADRLGNMAALMVEEKKMDAAEKLVAEVLCSASSVWGSRWEEDGVVHCLIQQRAESVFFQL
jgi:hypothetical protein